MQDSISGVMQQACCCACSQHPGTVYPLHLPTVAVLQSRAACSMKGVQAMYRRARLMHQDWVLQGHVHSCCVCSTRRSSKWGHLLTY